MFRIERNMINLKGARTVQIDTETGRVIEIAVEDSDVMSDAVTMHTSTNPQELLYAAREKAEYIINSARREAADIILAGREEIEENRRLAWDEGYAGGVLEGKRSYDEKMLECEESLRRVIKELHDERERTYSNLEDELVALALGIVRKVINPADEAVGGVFESLIKNALRQIAPDNKITIRVSSADYEKCFSEGSAVFELGNGIIVSASVLKDVSLGEYDCIIDKGDSTVNAGLETQLRHVELAFRKNA